MSLLSSLLNIFSSFTVNIQNGFQFLPVTKIRTGAVFSDMQTAVNYVDPAGNYFLGQSYGSSSVLSPPSFQQAPVYRPGNTTPPRSFPTSQPNGYVVPLGTNAVSMYHLSAEGLRILKAYEGLYQRPYYINNQKYIGYGHKLSSGDTTTYISRDQADSYLQTDVTAAEGVVKGVISQQITQGQFDALVDFAFTMNGSDFTSSDVVQKVNSSDIAGACTALSQYCYIQQNGVVGRSAHLTSRRTSNIRWMTMGINSYPVSS